MEGRGTRPDRGVFSIGETSGISGNGYNNRCIVFHCFIPFWGGADAPFSLGTLLNGVIRNHGKTEEKIQSEINTCGVRGEGVRLF